jgi:hypothetical protein
MRDAIRALAIDVRHEAVIFRPANVILCSVLNICCGALIIAIRF